jgi:hypothetical protein
MNQILGQSAFSLLVSLARKQIKIMQTQEISTQKTTGKKLRTAFFLKIFSILKVRTVNIDS